MDHHQTVDVKDLDTVVAADQSARAAARAAIKDHARANRVSGIA
jgi:hypothetical protein